MGKLTYFALGGTIASAATGGGRGASPSIPAAELVDSIAGTDWRSVDVVQFMQVPSPEITLIDLFRLVKAIRLAVDHGSSGIVVSQGTDTLEETAFVLDLLWNGEEPIVFTGAMRNPTLPGSDGTANLHSAFLVAGEEEARSCGVLAVLNDQIHAARFLRKMHTSNPAAFQSPGLGPIGWIFEGGPHIALRPRHSMHLPIPQDTDLPAVALLKLALGDDDRLIRAVSVLNFQGLIVEAFGGGHVRAEMMESLREISAKMPVVLASRIGAGEVLRRSYDFPGSELDLLSSGLIHAGHLDGLKARLLLILCLANRLNRGEISAAFARL